MNIDVPITYHPGQDEIFFQSNAKKKIVVKGRRFGLTRGVANYFIETLLDGISPLLWVDTVNSNIDRYIERYFYPVLKHIPAQHWQWRQQKKELAVFDHRLDMRSADQPERIEGFAYKKIFLNEAGIILRNEYLWHNAISPMMLDFNPEVIIGGTPKGKGLYHQLAVKAQDGTEKGWQYFHYTSYDNPYLNKADIDELANDMPEIVRKQEIFAEFLEDQSTVFRNLLQCATAMPQKEPIFGKRYYLGVDIARVVDYTVIDVLDEDGNQVYMDRFKTLDWKIQRERIRYQSVRWNKAQVWLDATSMGGDMMYEDLVDMRLSVKPYKFTNESKKQLVHALMLSLEQEKIRILNKEDPNGKVQFNEMVIFEYEISSSGLIRYQAPEGYHDDCVFALALANMGLQQQVGGAFAIPEVGTGDIWG
jgi:hypothetical protein